MLYRDSQSSVMFPTMLSRAQEKSWLQGWGSEISSTEVSLIKTLTLILPAVVPQMVIVSQTLHQDPRRTRGLRYCEPKDQVIGIQICKGHRAIGHLLQGPSLLLDQHQPCWRLGTEEKDWMWDYGPQPNSKEVSQRCGWDPTPARESQKPRVEKWFLDLFRKVVKAWCQSTSLSISFFTKIHYSLTQVEPYVQAHASYTETYEMGIVSSTLQMKRESLWDSR